MSVMHDCVVVGGGPAGLMAAVLLARARRDVVLLDAGHSRARWIPRTRNCPGYPIGVSGEMLLRRLRRQLRNHGLQVVDAVARGLVREGETFAIDTGDDRVRARTVVVATGVVDLLPAWGGIDAGIRDGVVRLCALCDGYDLVGRDIAVFGRADDCVPHACYLRKHSQRVTAIHPPGAECSAEHAALAAQMGIPVRVAAESDCRLESGRFHVKVDDGEHDFESVYVALGSRGRTAWLANAGLPLRGNGEVPVGAHCETTVPGLYAIGDVVSTLNQIAVAFGHASLAASAIDRYLPGNPR